MRPLLFVVVVALLTGCGPRLLYVGDPALEATVDTDSFEDRLRQDAAGAGYRATVAWPDARTLDAVQARAVIEDHDASVVVLSPYLSLMADEIAPQFPGRRFIAFYDGPEADNLVRVIFDSTDAMTEAGRVLGAWTLGDPARRVVVFVDESSDDSRDEAAALAAGYRETAGVPLATESFADPPAREEVRTRVQGAISEDERCVVLLLGAANTWAYEALRNETQLRFGYRHAPLGRDGRGLFSVQDEFGVALAPAVEAIEAGESAVGARDGARLVVVPSVLVLASDERSE